jgi:hypothetical protein
MGHGKAGWPSPLLLFTLDRENVREVQMGITRKNELPPAQFEFRRPNDESWPES